MAQIAERPVTMADPFPWDFGGHKTQGLLRDMLYDVVKRRAGPEIAAILDDPGQDLPLGPAAIPALQAISIWFQLLKISTEHSAVRDRRRNEAAHGPQSVNGSFAQALDRLKNQWYRRQYL